MDTIGNVIQTQERETEHGFVHLQFTADKARVSFLDTDGKTLYVFERNRDGDVKAVN